jgi:hypothetical protein
MAKLLKCNVLLRFYSCCVLLALNMVTDVPFYMTTDNLSKRHTIYDGKTKNYDRDDKSVTILMTRLTGNYDRVLIFL